MVFGRMATAPSYAVGRSTLGEEVSSNQEVQTIPFPRATNDQRRNNSNGMVKYGRMGGDGILWVTHTIVQQREEAALAQRCLCLRECGRIPVHKPMAE